MQRAGILTSVMERMWGERFVEESLPVLRTAMEKIKQNVVLFSWRSGENFYASPSEEVRGLRETVLVSLVRAFRNGPSFLRRVTPYQRLDFSL